MVKNNKNKSYSKKRKIGKNSYGLSSVLMQLYENITALNNSKYFAGVMMITLNLGSKYITLELSKSQERFLKYTIGRQVLLFSILWMGTRDIIISLILTAVFIILGNYLFNEHSKYNILPKKFDELKKELDTDGDNVISEKEIDDAIEILKRAHNKKNNTGNFIENKTHIPELFRENYI